MEEGSPLAGISHQRFATSTHKKVDGSSSGTTPAGMDAHNSHRPRLYRQRAERASIQIIPSASAQVLMNPHPPPSLNRGTNFCHAQSIPLLKFVVSLFVDHLCFLLSLCVCV